MPTRRAFSLLILAAGLYLLANQTQVGWVYIMANILIGLLLASFIYSLGLLAGIEGQRSFANVTTPQLANQADELILQSPDIFENDIVEVTLQYTNKNIRPVFLVAGEETSPFAAPTETKQHFFISSLFKNQSVSSSYRTAAYRRGIYTFPGQTLRSGGPFSFFSFRSKLTVPTEILIYPQYHPLKQLRLLENKGFTERHAMRVGLSSEVIGTREYRSGDSLRQVHWRSTARTGKLVVKEFANTDQQTITVVLDLSTAGSLGRGKFSTFETAIRIAASLGYYANRENIPFRITGRSEKWQPPAIALSWWGTLHYLARVQNDGAVPLAEVLRTLPPTPFVVVLVSQPTKQNLAALASLEQKGSRTLVILLNPEGDEIPPHIPTRSHDNLIIKSATPHNWATILDML